MAMAGRWGTWEELLLGGAVLRHGAAAWDAVAAELQSRTPFPHIFSAQACEAKFEELKELYSASDFWFEELRKRRVAELKKELEKSEDSIGSLQAKLENLSSHRDSGSNSECGTRRMTSSSSTEKSCDNDSFGRSMSKDRSSAGSFTQETHGDVLSTSQVVDSVAARDTQLKMEINSENKEENKGLDNGHVSLKKKRSKRKRRCCIIVKEGSTGDSDIISLVACTQRAEVFNGCKVDDRTPIGASSTSLGGKLTNMEMREILDSIVENKDVSIFERRLESQKKPQYKKLIRRHVDFLTIRKGILDGSISSMQELLREFLILSNNVFIFYPKDSAEYKSALTVLELAKMALGKIPNPTAWNPGEHDSSSSVVKGKSKEAAGILPCNEDSGKKAKLPFEGARPLKPETVKKRPHVDVTVEFPVRKKRAGLEGSRQRRYKEMEKYQVMVPLRLVRGE